MKLRRIVAGVGVLGISLGIGSAALGADGFTFKDCEISGAGVPGTLITIPQNGADKEWRVEIERNGTTLVFYGYNSDHQLARDPSPEPGNGEVYRAYHEDDLVRSGLGEGFDCDGGGDTSVPPTTQPPVEPPATTLPPDDGPAPGPKPGSGPVTTTTFAPNQPNADGECGEGFHDGGAGVCFADEEGG